MVAVYGFAKTALGGPVENATIMVKFPDTGQQDILLTNDDGSFEFTIPHFGAIEVVGAQREFSEMIREYFTIQDDPAIINVPFGSKDFWFAERVPPILQAKKDIEESITAHPNVFGIGINESKTNIVVYVVKGTNYEPIAQEYKEYDLKFVEIDMPHMVEDVRVRQRSHRPLLGGVSCGISSLGAGTLGAIFRDVYTNEPLLLSNAHVLVHDSDVFRAKTDEDYHVVYQPAIGDGGTPIDIVGVVDRWIPFRKDVSSLVDVALATPFVRTVPGILSSDAYGLVEEIQPNRGLRAPKIGETVFKYGRTTGMRKGRIIDTDFSTKVPYSGSTVHFRDQILIEIDIEPGDSGSVIIGEDGNIVGLVFAGTHDPSGKSYAVANKIRNVAVATNTTAGNTASGHVIPLDSVVTGENVVVGLAIVTALMVAKNIIEKRKYNYGM